MEFEDYDKRLVLQFNDIRLEDRGATTDITFLALPEARNRIVVLHGLVDTLRNLPRYVYELCRTPEEVDYHLKAVRELAKTYLADEQLFEALAQKLTARLKTPDSKFKEES